MTLSELIERVEGLEGPSREVDCEIAIALDFWPDWWKPSEGESLYVRPSNIGPDIAVQRAGKRKSLGDTPVWYTAMVYRDDTRLPCFTASLDAAIALTERVLPMMWRSIEWAGTSKPPSEWPVIEFGVGDFSSKIQAKTAPIALVLATLKALSAQERNDG